MNHQREAEWAEAKNRCHLSEEALRMAREMGLNPRNLIKNRPNKSELWKAPVEEWVRELYEKRFGNRKPQSPAQTGTPVQKPPRPPSAAAPPSPTPLAPPPNSEQIPHLQSSSGPPRNLLAEAERELEARFQRGEISDEELCEELGELEHSTPVSEGEIEQQNRHLLNRQRGFRLAAEQIAGFLAQIPSVQKVMLFGSVAAPLRKEVPRFRRFRRERIALWHECNDVDLAVWVTDLSNLRQLKKAVSAALNAHQARIAAAARGAQPSGGHVPSSSRHPSLSWQPLLLQHLPQRQT